MYLFTILLFCFQVIFPDDFDFKIPTDIGTSEHLRYYGCSLADQNQVQVGSISSSLNAHSLHFVNLFAEFGSKVPNPL